MSRSFIAIFLAFIAISSVTAINEKLIQRDRVTGFPCLGYMTEENSWFRFQDLVKTKETVSIPEFVWNGVVYTGSAVYSICADTQVDFTDKECPSMEAPGSAGYFKLLRSTDNSTICMPFKAANQTGFDLERINSTEYKVHLKAGTSSGNTLIPDFNIKCQTQQSTFAKYNSGDIIAINVNSNSYCGGAVSDLANFLGYKLRFFTWVLIPLAIFMLFYGITFIKTVMFIIGFIFGTLFTMMVSIVIVEPQYLLQTKTALTILAISVIVGILIGWLISKLTKIYLLVAGGFLGYVLSFELLRIFAAIVSFNMSEGARLGSTIGFILIFAILGYFIHDHIIIISTSVGGGFLLVLAVGTLLRNLPDPVDIVKAYEVDPAAARRYKAYAAGYLLSAIVLSILGMCYQYKQRRNRLEKMHAEDGTDSENMAKLYPQYEFYAWNMNYAGSPAYNNANAYI